MILIVDDKKENLFSLKALLELHRFSVDTASSGEQALKKVLKNNYALIVLDVQMPEMDGYEVAEALSGYSKSKDLPILFLSAVNIDKRFITKGYTSGGVDYVTKPFDPDILLLKIKTFYRLSVQTKELAQIQATLEQKVAERTKELVQINHDLEISNTELQQYAFVASHDLQEPVRKILTFSKLIADKYLPAQSEGGNYINRIINSSQRMHTLIDDLLNYSKLSALPDFQLTNLNTVLEETLVDLELSITEKGAVINRDTLPQAEVIPGQMRQLFQNLIGNALKFSKEGVPPVITIESSRIAQKTFDSTESASGAFFRITITDNGIGFEEKYTDKIFSIFQRLHSREEYTGTGIGLAIVKKIVAKHNGIIKAAGRQGTGAVFTILLPILQNPVASHSM